MAGPCWRGYLFLSGECILDSTTCLLGLLLAKMEIMISLHRSIRVHGHHGTAAVMQKSGRAQAGGSLFCFWFFMFSLAHDSRSLCGQICCAGC